MDKLDRQAGHPIRNLWSEHRRILAEGKNAGRHDVLISATESRPNGQGGCAERAKTGLVYVLPEAMTEGARIDFLPPKDI